MARWVTWWVLPSFLTDTHHQPTLSFPSLSLYIYLFISFFLALCPESLPLFHSFLFFFFYPFSLPSSRTLCFFIGQPEILLSLYFFKSFYMPYICKFCFLSLKLLKFLRTSFLIYKFSQFYLWFSPSPFTFRSNSHFSLFFSSLRPWLIKKSSKKNFPHHCAQLRKTSKLN